MNWVLWGDEDLSYIGVSMSMLEGDAGTKVLESAASAGPMFSYSGRPISAGTTAVSGSVTLDAKAGNVKLKIVNK